MRKHPLRDFIDFEFNKETSKTDITAYRSTEKLVTDMLTLGQAFKVSTVRPENNVLDETKVVNRPYSQIDDLADLNNEINDLSNKLKSKQTPSI